MTLRQLAVAAVLVASAVASAVYVSGSPLSSDEGWYLAGAWRAAAGAIPYSDFAYSQGPLVPLAGGAAMHLTGFGLVQQRAIGAAAGLLGLVLLAVATRRLAPGMPAAYGILPSALGLGWLSQVALGNTFGLASLFLALSVVLVVAPRGTGSGAGAVAAATLAVGCRLLAAPFAAILWAGTALRGRRAAAVGALAGLLTVSVLFLPFLVLAPGPTRFWLVGYHLGSSFVRERASVVSEALSLFPSLPLLLGAGAWGLWRGAWRAAPAAATVFAAGVASVVSNLALPSSYGGYAAPFVPAVSVSAVALVFAGTPPSSRGRAAGLLASAAAALGLAFPAPVDPDELADLGRAAAALRRVSPERSRVFSARPEVAIQAGRDVWPGLEMGMFSLTEEMPEARAASLHLVTPARCREILADPRTGAAVLYVDPLWNFPRSVPSLRTLSPTAASGVNEAVRARYVPAWSGSRYVVLVPAPPPRAR